MASRLRSVLAACAAGLIALVAAAPAAGVNREFFGVVPIVPVSQGEFEHLGRGKIGTLRLVLSWPTVEPAAGQRNWAFYDAVFEQAALQGIRVMPTLFGSPSFAAARTERPPAKAGRAAWTRFVADAVARYGSGGVFWQQFAARRPGSAPFPPIYWQLWNEVNSPRFWLRKPNARQYVRLLRPTAGAIRAADGQAQVVLAGLFGRKGEKASVRVAEYLEQLYEVRKVKKLFDAVAIHPYAATPREAIRTVRRMRRLLRSHGDGKVPIWVTELGWATSGRPTTFTTGHAGQASYLESSIGGLAAKSARLGVAGVIWYALRDSLSGDDWVYRTGLFEANGTPKPSWHSYLKLTGGSYQPPPPGAPPPPPPPASCPLPPLPC